MPASVRGGDNSQPLGGSPSPRSRSICGAGESRREHRESKDAASVTGVEERRTWFRNYRNNVPNGQRAVLFAGQYAPGLSPGTLLTFAGE